ncbi:MAG: cytochrome c biogenesis CcdA family protein [bacterium]|nr:cytochrome c biogenesis CcdA family protein [bacterium]
MQALLFNTSAVAAFFGGMLALIAPCCITFMLPSYFAHAFKSRVDILKVTTVFGAGVAVVLVPIGIGVAALAQVFSRFHQEIFLLAGIFLVFLGLFSLLGKSFELPFAKTAVKWNPQNYTSVFILGVFSGAASSCCAPVLAGVLTLTAISASLVQALILSLIYVFGMVFPLFVMAYFWDQFEWSKSPLVKGKLFSFKVFGKQFHSHTTNLASGTMFLLMGIFVLYLAWVGNESLAPSWQKALSGYASSQIESIALATKGLPDFIFLVILFVIAGLFIYKGFFSKTPKKEVKTDESETN